MPEEVDMTVLFILLGALVALILVCIGIVIGLSLAESLTKRHFPQE